jgi:hypothetical protein
MVVALLIMFTSMSAAVNGEILSWQAAFATLPALLALAAFEIAKLIHKSKK